MPINEHPPCGTILLADFTQGFVEPEMTKRRPVVVVSPKISLRGGLCTVVAISTKPPKFLLSHHYELKALNPPLPPPFHEGPNWIKGDMIISVGFHRLDLIRLGKSQYGKRLYRFDLLPASEMREIRRCMLSSLGLSNLTKHL